MALGVQGPLGFLAGGAGGGNDGEKAAVNSSSGSQGFFGLILVTPCREVGRDGGISTAPPLKAGHGDLQVPPLLAFSSTGTSLGGGWG